MSGDSRAGSFIAGLLLSVPLAWLAAMAGICLSKAMLYVIVLIPHDRCLR
jgi:hypothetical protein